MVNLSKVGDQNYKAYVGPLDRYDFMGATQFRLLSTLGLRSHHKLLDFGCGSLRAGKLFIPYLDASNYFGQDPNQSLIDEGIKKELGESIKDIKKPNFSNLDNFEVGFNEKFDFAVAQSIFSHTNLQLTKKGLLAIYNALSDDGLAVVTIIEGNDYKGVQEWSYPECTTYQPSTIKHVMNEMGFKWRRLYWFHPSQTWFVIAKKKSRLPSFLDTLFLLGGEEVGSSAYKKQHFLSNRLFSIKKKLKRLKGL